jgi:hypothetical protein
MSAPRVPPFMGVTANALRTSAHLRRPPTTDRRANLPANDRPRRTGRLAGDPDLLPACCASGASFLARHAFFPLLGIRQNDTNRSNPHKAISMRMHDCLRTAVASSAERGLQVKADPMNSVSRRSMLAEAASWPLVVRVELSGEAGLAGKDTNTITAVRRRYKSKGPFDDR